MQQRPYASDHEVALLVLRYLESHGYKNAARAFRSDAVSALSAGGNARVLPLETVVNRYLELRADAEARKRAVNKAAEAGSDAQEVLSQVLDLIEEARSNPQRMIGSSRKRRRPRALPLSDMDTGDEDNGGSVTQSSFPRGPSPKRASRRKSAPLYSSSIGVSSSALASVPRGRIGASLIERLSKGNVKSLIQSSINASLAQRRKRGANRVRFDPSTVADEILNNPDMDRVVREFAMNPPKKEEEEEEDDELVLGDDDFEGISDTRTKGRKVSPPTMDESSLQSDEDEEEEELEVDTMMQSPPRPPPPTKPSSSPPKTRASPPTPNSQVRRSSRKKSTPQRLQVDKSKSFSIDDILKKVHGH